MLTVGRIVSAIMMDGPGCGSGFGAGGVAATDEGCTELGATLINTGATATDVDDAGCAETLAVVAAMTGAGSTGPAAFTFTAGEFVATDVDIVGARLTIAVAGTVETEADGAGCAVTLAVAAIGTGAAIASRAFMLTTVGIMAAGVSRSGWEPGFAAGELEATSADLNACGASSASACSFDDGSPPPHAVRKRQATATAVSMPGRE